MPIVTRITSCRLCAHSGLRLVLPLQPTPIGDYYLPPDKHPEKLETYPLDLYQCERCGHAQLGHLINPEVIYSQYLYTTSVSLGLKEHFRKYADHVIQKLQLAPGSFVIDIGSNDGTLLREFQARGMRVLGIDPAREIAAQATASGIPTRNAFFTPEVANSVRLEHGPADLVIANNVVANVPNPTEFFTAVHSLLKPTSSFVWETGYLRYLAEGCVFDNIHHEHIDYYAIHPLLGFCERLGLKIYDVEVSESKGSSIRTFVSLANSAFAVSHSVSELSTREVDRGYFTPAPYAQLDARLEKVCTELHHELDSLQQAGKTVAGFGAAIGTTTMLYRFHLGNRLQTLIDDNPIRHGLHSPGYNIPVCDASILTGPNRPDVVIILAWRYADAIVKRHRSYLETGGRFLKVLPEFEYVREA